MQNRLKVQSGNLIIRKEELLMGRNDLCFCGSGKKQKKCHPNINEDSVAAKTIKLYARLSKQLDENIYGKKNVKCEKGCNACCKDYFAISEVEFAIIMDYLFNNCGVEKTNMIIEKAIALTEKFRKNNPEYYKQLEENISGKAMNYMVRINLENMPEKQEECVFLDEGGGCCIYDARPIICRTHGVCYYSRDSEHKICDKIPDNINNKDNMLNIDDYRMEIANVGNYRKKGNGKVLCRRKYPIFYFMKMYFGNGRTVADYFKHPVIHNILHGNEELLYDCICNFNRMNRMIK